MWRPRYSNAPVDCSPTADSRTIGPSRSVLGAEAMYGPHARAEATREVILKIAVAHSRERALELFARKSIRRPPRMAQGITGFAVGRPAVQPVVRLASCLIPQNACTHKSNSAGRPWP